MSFLLHNLLLRDGASAAPAATVSGAALLAAGYAQAFALDFTDDSAWIKDTGTPANDLDLSSGLSLSSTLTYTAPSLKMTMGPSGTLRFQAHNLCLQSDALDNAAWSKSHVAATAAATTINGYVLNRLQHSTVTSAQHIADNSSIGTPGVLSATYSVSVIAAADEESMLYLRVRRADGAYIYAYFNLATGSPGTSPNWDSTTMTDLGGGVYLCRGNFTQTSTGATNVQIGVGIAQADGDATHDTAVVSEGLYVGRAHLRRTPSDSTYLATTSAARYALPLEWDSAGNALGLLVEEARTNLLTYSDDLTNAAWSKTNATAAKTATGPDGIANSASTLTATAGNATALQAITSASAARITHVWLKRRTGTGDIDLTQDNGSTWTTQAITTSWARYALGSVTSANPTVGIRIVTSGDEVDVALFQHEPGAFVTSPIPTLGSTVTRAVDNISKATSGFAFDGLTTTAFANFEHVGPAKGAIDGRALSISSGATQRHIELFSRVAGTVQTYAAAGTMSVDIGSSAGQFVKAALALAANDGAGTVDGGAVVTDNTVTVGQTPTTLFIGLYGGGSNSLNGHIKQILCVPERLANAALQTLTGA